MSMGCSVCHLCRGVVRCSTLQKKTILLSCQTKHMTQPMRNMMSIVEVRKDLQKIVGQRGTFSDDKPDRSSLHSHLVDDQTKLAPRLIKDSLHSAVIPLSDKYFREKYINAYRNVRFGILLEDLDLFAGHVAYRHCDPSVVDTGISPLSIVTAMVDEVNIRQSVIDATQDIIMSGHVSWSGKSSLEITMLLKQSDIPVLDAQFVMVARDPESKKSAIIHPLQPVTEEEKKMFEAGNRNKIRRLEEAKESLFETSPSVEESQLVHKLFQDTLDARSKSFHTHVLPEGSVWLESTKLKNCIVCFPEQRNIHYKIFGGYLMRKGFELGYANACVFSKRVPRVVAMDDIIFHCPVPVGSILLMSSQISYVEKQHFTCRVHAEVMDPRTGESRTSNVFHLMFACDGNIPNVMPKTYGESMLYLDGRRRLRRSNTLL
ncbi:acyl-coenzyme A thioesterase 9, mitochondrial-like isoform X2 [Clavelina lepadiformis]|uniref:HotDog ACOT-type domain-containing protein n=1 Tax=Clavelina lepadiformis TaxID=159417 RepID=A0ABP0H3A2_CLALP